MRLTTRWPLLPLVFVLAACQGGNLTLPGEAPAAEPSAGEEATSDAAPIAEATVEATTEAAAEATVEATAEASTDGAADDAFEATPALSDGTADAALADASAQQRTVMEIRNVGTAMFSWLTDQVGAAPPDAESPRAVVAARAWPWAPRAGHAFALRRFDLGASVLAVPIQSSDPANSVDLTNIPEISRTELEKLLVPVYLQELPEKDGWGNLYAYQLDVANPLSRQVMAIRSPGRDGAYSGSGMSYVVSAFPPTDYDEDIVWSDGFFVRWPQQTDGM